MQYIYIMEYYSAIKEMKYSYFLQHESWKHYASLKKPDLKDYIL